MSTGFFRTSKFFDPKYGVSGNMMLLWELTWPKGSEYWREVRCQYPRVRELSNLRRVNHFVLSEHVIHFE